MIQIAVIEDHFDDYMRLNHALEDFFSKREETYHLKHYTDAVSFLEEFQSQFDLIFLDIDLPKMNGIKAAKKIREKDPIVSLVFLTNLAQYAIHGYEVNAVDYLLKPLNIYSFHLKMPKVISQIKHNSKEKISIVTKNAIQQFFISDIYYVEIISHTLYYHTERGTFTTHDSLQNAESMLAPYHFHRCNNCYLVNLIHVTSIVDNTVIVGPHQLTISRPKKKTFINELTKFLGGQLTCI